MINENELKNIESLSVPALKELRDKCAVLTEMLEMKLEEKKREQLFYV